MILRFILLHNHANLLCNIFTLSRQYLKGPAHVLNVNVLVRVQAGGGGQVRVDLRPVQARTGARQVHHLCLHGRPVLQGRPFSPPFREISN